MLELCWLEGRFGIGQSERVLFDLQQSCCEAIFSEFQYRLGVRPSLIDLLPSPSRLPMNVMGHSF